MSRFKLVTTAKTEGVDEAAVSAAAIQAYPGYRVAKVNDLGDKWEVRLDQKVSASKREAAPPPDFLKEKDDAGGDAEDADSSDSADKPDPDADSDAADSDEKSEEGDAKDKSDGGDSKKDPVKAIESVIGELKGLLDQLGGHASDLKDKADKVDEIHEITKGTGDVDSMESVPPVPPLDDPAAVGPTPGPPKPPRKPPVPTGKRPGGPVPGVPGVFGSRQTEIVEHPIKDDDGEYTMSDVLSAISEHPDLTDYKVEDIKTVSESNVYVAKLKKN